MSAPAFTPRPWLLSRMPSAEELATMKGKTLAEHEGYYRATSGAWIVTYTSDEEDMPGGPICEVSFKGQAKRGQAYCAPDPEGQANARLIAAAPELYEALAAITTPTGFANLESGEIGTHAAALAALAKARGEAA